LPVVDEQGVMEGIITKGDVTARLLKALQRSFQEDELKTYRASHLFEDIRIESTSLILRIHNKPRDFTHAAPPLAIINALSCVGAPAANCPPLWYCRV